MILVIGNPKSWTCEGRPDPRLGGYGFARLAELDAALLRGLSPDMVLSALMGEGFDALEVAGRLAELGYAGPYRALTGPLPDPDAVREEVRAAAPDLDFDLVVVSPPPGG